MTSRNISAILLAAGFSRRMGTLKALLPWEGMPLIHYQIQQLQNTGIKKIIVVLGYQAQLLEKIIAPCDAEIVFNENYKEGKSLSIRKGASRICENAEGILISSVDQPVPSETLFKIVHSFYENESTIVIPAYQGKSGHPVLLHSKLKKDLLTVSESTKGLRQVMQNHGDQIVYADVNDPSILFNLNEPADYIRVLDYMYK